MRAKKNQKINFKISFLIVILFSTIFLSSISYARADNFHEEDKSRDLYEITLLDFLYVMGDSMPDRPDTEEEVKDMIEAMISRSEECSGPGEIDLEEMWYVENADDTYGLFLVEMEDDIDDIDYCRIYGLAIRDDDTWCSWEIENDGGSEDYEWHTEDEDDEDALGGISGRRAGIWVNKSAYIYDEDDSFYVIVMTIDGSWSDPLHAFIRYDVYPNSLIPEDPSVYTGIDPITTWLNDVANFLFGFLFDGYIPFLVLIAIALVIAQILLDRINRILHWIGFGLLIFLLWPIIWFMLSVNLVGIMGIPDLFGISTVICLSWFLTFVALSLLNNFNVFKRYKFAFTAGCISIIFQQIVYLILTMSQDSVLGLISLIIGTIGLTALLIISKKFGRKFKS